MKKIISLALLFVFSTLTIVTSPLFFNPAQAQTELNASKWQNSINFRIFNKDLSLNAFTENIDNIEPDILERINLKDSPLEIGQQNTALVYEEGQSKYSNTDLTDGFILNEVSIEGITVFDPQKIQDIQDGLNSYVGEKINEEGLRSILNEIEELYVRSSYSQVYVVARYNVNGVVAITVKEPIVDSIEILYFNESYELVEGITPEYEIRNRLLTSVGDRLNDVFLAVDRGKVKEIGISRNADIIPRKINADNHYV
ncbi:MAG: POTRA domain-containing protein, partial [Cyanobacteria bacterium J06635_15]